jgi:hypothetical protein
LKNRRGEFSGELSGFDGLWAVLEEVGGFARIINMFFLRSFRPTFRICRIWRQSVSSSMVIDFSGAHFLLLGCSCFLSSVWLSINSIYSEIIKKICLFYKHQQFTNIKFSYVY